MGWQKLWQSNGLVKLKIHKVLIVVKPIFDREFLIEKRYFMSFKEFLKGWFCVILPSIVPIVLYSMIISVFYDLLGATGVTVFIMITITPAMFIFLKIIDYLANRWK